jgi:hypothetical protein
VKKNWLVFVAVAVGAYVVALPRVAPANASDTSSISACDSWTREGTTIWDCTLRNSYPDFYVKNYMKVYFDLIHRPGKTVSVGAIKRSFSGTQVVDKKDVVLSSGSSPVFKEYEVTASQVLTNASQWDYVSAWVSGADEVIGVAAALTQ